MIDNMKRFLNYLIIAILGIGMVGCNDFLEESSQDEVRPSTIGDLEQLLLGEGYFRDEVIIFPWLELLTDNIQNSFTVNDRHQSIVRQGVPVFTWQADMFETMAIESAGYIDTWETLYSKIKGCNVVLDMLDRVSGEEGSKLNQKGQALALRSYYYFLLVNLFGEPYNKEGIDVNQALGVPLILSSAVKDDFPARESLARVYGQIETDLLEAADLLDKYGQNNIKYKVTPLFVYNLLSRMYLYMENWEKTAYYASIVIERNPRLVRLSACYTIEEDPWGFFPPTLTFNKTLGGVLNYNSPELIWGYGNPGSDKNPYFVIPDFFTFPGSLPVFAISEKFLATYDEKDLRPEYFFSVYLKSYIPPVKGKLMGHKIGDGNGGNSPRGMRVAEAYLNRAEANIRLFLKNGNDALRVSALKDLNYLREHRFYEPYQDVEITDGEDLLEFCLEERRKEFIQEDHRWFDLRRCGMPELVHEYTVTEGQTQEVRLEAGSDRYVLRIPLKVLDKNPALIQNP